MAKVAWLCALTAIAEWIRVDVVPTAFHMVRSAERPNVTKKVLHDMRSWVRAKPKNNKHGLGGGGLWGSNPR